MQQEAMRGVYPILVTPFDEQGRVDEESLHRLTEFCLECGVHGLGIALGSEVFRLSEAERVRVTRIVVEQVRRRVPVVINTGAAGTDLAVEYSLAAQENGADALMIMPPSFMPTSPAEVREYFKAISDAVRIPIFIQDTTTVPVSGNLARQIAEESEHVRYIKVESLPTPVKVADAVAHSGGLLTVFGGAGGNYLIEELRRGSVGTMPGCGQPEAFVEVWNLFQQGDECGAEEVFYNKILPFNRLAAQTWGAFYHVNKEVLRQRGVIACARVRGPVAPLDDLTRRELQAAYDRIYGAG
jgi:4-hydroxy-tetrahydrodipicolinate synthase